MTGTDKQKHAPRPRPPVAPLTPEEHQKIRDFIARVKKQFGPRRWEKYKAERARKLARVEAARVLKQERRNARK